MLSDPSDLISYSLDHSMVRYPERYKRIPEVVITPSSPNEILEIVKICNKEHIPITPRGGGTGMAGNAIPLFGGILIDTKKMSKIVEIDEDNMIATVQSGINVSVLNDNLKKRGLRSGDLPESGRSSTIGERINTNGIGHLSLRYGTMMDQVIGLEAVLPYGQIMKFNSQGYKVKRSSTGFPLKNLFFGSQGTLGIITEAIIRIFPLPEKVLTGVFGFNDLKSTFQAATRLLKSDIARANR